MPDHDSLVRASLLGVALFGGCAVYDVPTLAGAPAGSANGGDGSGGSHGGATSAAPLAGLDGRGGRRASIVVDGGLGGANGGGHNGGRDDGGGAGTGGAAGDSSADAAGGDASAAAGEGSGGAAGGGSSNGSTSCASGWRNQSACDQCATQVQPDLQACAVILDCYVSKSCGPSSCAGADQKCGPNQLGEGSAAYSIAQDVYTCICKQSPG